MTQRKNLTGQRFGKLVAQYPYGSDKRTQWWCKCDCGREKAVRTGDLLSGNTKTCGICSRKEAAQKSAEKNRGRLSPKIQDLTGRRFGRLTVLRRAEQRNETSGVVQWECRCDCGAVVVKRGDALKSGHTRSCGCLKHETGQKRAAEMNAPERRVSRIIDLTGQRFGRLLVIGRDMSRTEHGKAYWLCKCDCGKTTSVQSSKLRSGHTKSCGCLGLEHATEAKIKHGETKTRLYRCWHSMKERCSLPSQVSYKYYGGRGISVCNEWSGSGGYIAFKEWAMANGYRDDLTIDRIDPDGDYDPSNCRWITLSENIRRKRRGKEKIIKEV